ncbi:DUF2460 domain-containing protein [Zavarzinia sp. CC-PAN008]|uniref:DUF2460 domain-containing protein n=1 Tax=Zavarzinia sp. CC-PAN008 TaxID=3243332 RepID=UPI003F7473A5
MSGGILPIVFPGAIAQGSSGGPSYSTTVVTLASGHEQRNINWAQARHRYNVARGITTAQRLEQVVAHFHAVQGRALGFLYPDPLDHGSGPGGIEPTPLDQAIGTGDGATTAFQLRKTYARGGAERSRTITRPVPGSVRCAVNGTETAAFTVDTTTGIVSFASAPGAGLLVQAGFRFLVPVRFDTDHLETSWEAWAAQAVAELPLIEIREC